MIFEVHVVVLEFLVPITYCIFVQLCGKGRPVHPKMGNQRYAADGQGGRRAGRHLYRTVFESMFSS